MFLDKFRRICSPSAMPNERSMDAFPFSCRCGTGRLQGIGTDCKPDVRVPSMQIDNLLFLTAFR
jgi:hypothetical protein